MNIIYFIYSLNKQFDCIKEPNRFYIFFGIFVPVIIIANLPYDLAMYLGWGFIGVMLVMRVLYIHGTMTRYLIKRGLLK